jgi:hypothetical protein
VSDERIIVLVTDKGDSKHGEVSVLEDPEKAERLVETLLEAGFEQERIRVFSGRASEFKISQRPVVALVADGEELPPPEVETVAAAAEPAVAESAIAPAPEEGASAQEPQDETAEGEEAPVGEEAAPVRFSSLFRSA